MKGNEGSNGKRSEEIERDMKAKMDTKRRKE
jgi:hypothetical protein